MVAELYTIRDFIRYATSSFNEAELYYGHGTDNAWDDAVALILHTLHLPHTIHPATLDANLTQKEKTTILSLIDKRISQRIPVPYLIHEAWFAGLSFYVDERVLIPRSPIAELIENQFAPWILAEDINHILDLCTGSGCIAIACAKAFPHAEIDASDISADALAVAKINVLRHEVEDQVSLHQSDLFKNLPSRQYDIIVSNPPYVSLEEMEMLYTKQSFAEYRHEPKLGLSGGANGLEIIMRILKEARTFLNPHGILVVETGNSEDELKKILPTVPFTWVEFQRGDGGVFVLNATEIPHLE